MVNTLTLFLMVQSVIAMIESVLVPSSFLVQLSFLYFQPFDWMTWLCLTFTLPLVAAMLFLVTCHDNGRFVKVDCVREMGTAFYSVSVMLLHQSKSRTLKGKVKG